jgi:hypothetical protein
MKLDSRVRRGEEGQSLLLALVFLLGISVMIAALLNEAFTSFATRSAFKNATQQQYAADATIEAAIANLRTPANDNAFQPFTPAQWYNPSSGGCPNMANNSLVTITIAPTVTWTYRADCEAEPPGGLGQIEVLIVACPAGGSEDPTVETRPGCGINQANPSPSADAAMTATVWFTQQANPSYPSIATIVNWSGLQGSGT